MEYIVRDLERKFMKMNQVFKVILVTGARQVGKTTMLKHLAAGDNRTFVTMDDAQNRELARRDPKLFFQMYNPPLLIDEVQKAPELFEAMKEICDSSEESGLFWLTGSQSQKLIRQAGDSLAGRICILHMYGLSQAERLNIFGLPEFSFTMEGLSERQRHFPANNIREVYDAIWKGSMPGTLLMDQEQRNAYYDSYINTYLMRDAVDDNGIKDTAGFLRVLRACAAFAGNLLNYSDLAAAGDVSIPTAKAWVKILENMGILYLLEPYYNNELKRMIKTPKLYFCDTGLCAWLSMWTNRDVLMNGAASGHFLENFVVMEFVRLYSSASEKTGLTFYRDTNQKEIDLIVDTDGSLHPIEIKRSAAPERKLVKAFDVLKKASQPVKNGGIVCMTEKVFPVDDKNYLIPCNII